MLEDDAAIREAMAAQPRGRVRFEFPGAATRVVAFELVLRGDGRLDVDWPECGETRAREPARAVIAFRCAEEAMRVLRREIDPESAVGLGMIRVTGYLPAADAVNLVLEPVTAYIPPL